MFSSPSSNFRLEVLLSTLISLTSATIWPSNTGLAAPCQEKAISAQWHDTVAGNYIKMWNGDLSYLNKSLAPNVVQYIDRLPTGNGSIEVTVTNSTAFKSFIDFSREPYAQYTFTSNIRIGVDNIVALRWTLSAVPKTAPANLTVAINGTDILILNRCSGLIEEVQGSSDTINFSHQLGQTLGKV